MKSIFFCCLISSCLCAFADSNDMAPEISSDQPILIDRNTQEMIAKGNARLQCATCQLEADEIHYIQSNGKARATGCVSALHPPFRIVAQELSYDTTTSLLHGRTLRFGNAPFYIKADTADAAEKTIRAHHATIYFREPSTFSLNARAQEVNFLPSNTFEAKNILFFLGSVPFFYAPRYRFSPDTFLTHTKIKLGHDSSLGYFIQSQWPPYAFQHHHFRAILDAYSRRGYGYGAHFSSEKFNSDLPYRLHLQGYYIADRGHREDDFFQNPIARRRARTQFSYQQQFLEHFHVKSHIHWWSDSEIFSDFYDHDYRRDPFPDHFVEFKHRQNSILSTAFVRVPLHRFQSSTQRLPSLRCEYFPKTIGESSLYQQGFIDFTHLHREDRGEIFLKSHEKNSLHARRIEVAYQISRPFSWDHFLCWTPILGFRGTSYSSLSLPQKSFHRALGQIGFDLDGHIYRSMSYENAFWEIHGLRHVVHPILQYRWIPSAEKHWDKIPALDDFTQDTHLPIIDLLERRDAERLYRSHVLRIGCENFLQTAGGILYLARDLMQFHIYQDIYPQRPIPLSLPDDSKLSSHHLSHTHVHFQINPAEFLQLQMGLRINPVAKNLEEWNTSCRILSGDLWQVQVGNRYRRHSTREYTIEFSGKLNAVTQWEIFAKWDAHFRRIEEHHYSLTRQVSQTWNVEARLSFHHRHSRKQRSIFSISCHLIRW
jgi:LPS-assembly protein